MLLRVLTVYFILLASSFFFLQANAGERKIIIIAHRGGYEQFPEQTIPAYEYSASHGVDFIECDVWLTADSQAILIHDETYRRTTNVIEEFGSDKKISELTLAEARRLFINGGLGWKTEYERMFRIPTLDEFLEVAKKYDVGVNIEVKLQHQKTRTLIMEALQRHNFDLNKVILNNFYGVVVPPPWKMGSQTGVTTVPLPHFSDSLGVLTGRKIYYSVSDSSLVYNPMSINGVFYFPKDTIASEDILRLASRWNLDKYYFLLKIASDSTLLIQYRQTNGQYISRKSSYKFLGGELRCFILFTQDSLEVVLNDTSRFFFNQTSFLQESREPRLVIGGFNLPAPFYIKKFAVQNNQTDSLLFDPIKNINYSTYRTKLMPFNFSIQPMNYMGLPVEVYTQELTEYYNELGFKTLVWTVNDRLVFEKILKDENVDGVFTGYPLLFDSILFSANEEHQYNVLHPAELGNSYPNPFNGVVSIPVIVKTPNEYSLDIFDIMGRKIKNVFKKSLKGKQYLFSWDGKNEQQQTVSSGIYLVQLKSSSYAVIRKILLIK